MVWISEKERQSVGVCRRRMARQMHLSTEYGVIVHAEFGMYVCDYLSS